MHLAPENKNSYFFFTPHTTYLPLTHRIDENQSPTDEIRLVSSHSFP